MDMQWVYANKPDTAAVDSLATAINVNAYLAQLLLQRGVGTFDQAKTFFRPQLEELPDPMTMADMPKAVERLVAAVGANEKILFYGDYDVDGTTSVALMMSFFRDHYDNIGYYIPDRYAEGYGVSLAGIDYARKEGYSLIITLDCGVKAHQNIAQAQASRIRWKTGSCLERGKPGRDGVRSPPPRRRATPRPGGAQSAARRLPLP